MLRFQKLSSPSHSLTLRQRLLGTFGVGILLLGEATAVLAVTPTLTTAPKGQTTTIAQLFPPQNYPPQNYPPQSYPPSYPNGCGPQSCRINIGQGLALQQGQVLLARYRGQDRIIVQKGETRDLTLRLSQPITNSAGQVIIPAESEITGQIVPVEGGGQFVANRLLVSNRVYNLSAQSQLLKDGKDPRQTSTGAIAGDAAIGAAGGVVLGRVLGRRRINVGQVLGGAAAGVLVGNLTAPRTVTIDPNTEFQLQLTSNVNL